MNGRIKDRGYACETILDIIIRLEATKAIEQADLDPSEFTLDEEGQEQFMNPPLTDGKFCRLHYDSPSYRAEAIVTIDLENEAADLEDAAADLETRVYKRD